MPSLFHGENGEEEMLAFLCALEAFYREEKKHKFLRAFESCCYGVCWLEWESGALDVSSSILRAGSLLTEMKNAVGRKKK